VTTPRLEVRLARDPGDAAWRDLLRAVPAAHRARLVAGGGDALPADLLRRARDAGFVRVRLSWTRPEAPPDLADLAVAAGANELEIDAAAGPWARIRQLRGDGLLAHVRLRASPARPPAGNPCDADELWLDGGDAAPAAVDAALAAVGPAFRRVAVGGMPLCALSGLDPARVLANALSVRPFDGGPGLVLPFEAPDRAYFDPCGRCALALACDGMPAAGLAATRAPFRIRAFPDGPSLDVPAGPAGVARRRHPPGFLSGKVHVLAVAAGARPCGRLALAPEGLSRALALLGRMGLRTAVVLPHEAPADLDTRDAATAPAHVFFSRDGSAGRAADLERRFAAAEASGMPTGTEAFSRALGRILGYPDCCVQAFVDAGPAVPTDALIRAAHGRSRRFHWALNHLDARGAFPLVAHLPCRYDCGPSIDLALRVHGALDALYPYLGTAARRALARPVLFVDGARLAAFDGTPDDDGIGLSYRSVDPLGLRDAAGGGDPDWAAAVATLAGGSRLRAGAEGVRVARADGTTDVLPVGTAPCLFPFSGRDQEG
jgi:hypothetical protein